MPDSRNVRLPSAMVEKLAAIARATPGASIADIVVPILTGPVDRKFAKIPDMEREYALRRIALLRSPEPV